MLQNNIFLELSLPERKEFFRIMYQTKNKNLVFDLASRIKSYMESKN